MPHIKAKTPITEGHERYEAAENRFEVELEGAPTWRKNQVLSTEMIDLKIAGINTRKQEDMDRYDAEIAYWEGVKAELLV